MIVLHLEISKKIGYWKELKPALGGSIGEPMLCNTSKPVTDVKKANRATGKKFQMIIQIREPKSPWEIVHMDWVIALPPGGDRSDNAFLVLLDRYSRISMLLPCHKDDTVVDRAIIIWNKASSHTCLCQNIISDRDPKFTSALWTNLHKLFGTKVAFSTDYHPQTDSLAERMIQTLEDIIRKFCAYGL
ncbi:hypothetical protein O181_009233 [Austropuccinia psidii MF-1]|uniref:Integrase catalytic domain-containing protein n=1 Tax=Austropuccinia psidii MF-1 TaxID=1389203 RepID=A0A9Q3BQP8_9BASI|nr:hypothetical protein [Austropuccinia psidii MF-1]